MTVLSKQELMQEIVGQASLCPHKLAGAPSTCVVVRPPKCLVGHRKSKAVVVHAYTHYLSLNSSLTSSINIRDRISLGTS